MYININIYTDTYIYTYVLLVVAKGQLASVCGLLNTMGPTSSQLQVFASPTSSCGLAVFTLRGSEPFVPEKSNVPTSPIIPHRPLMAPTGLS